MQPVSVTAAVLTYNESEMITGCLSTLEWCEQVLVLDSGSTDNTVSLAKAMGAAVILSQEKSFAERRNQLLAACKTKWILYIDADERITPTLAQQIAQAIADNAFDVVSFPRRNYFFGRQFNHGGWQDEVITRLFRVTSLRGWQGSIHESPVYEGSILQLEDPLWHFSHRSVVDGLEKTTMWTPMEAQLLANTIKQQVSFWTVLRKGMGEAWRRGILQAGWRDGPAGLMEVLTQSINRMLVYMQVWERQQVPHLTEQYDSLEKKVTSLWQKSR